MNRRCCELEKHFWLDLNWAREHHSTLLKLYRDQWIAVFNKEVIAHGRSGGEVEREAKTKTGSSPFSMYFVDSGSNIYATETLF